MSQENFQGQQFSEDIVQDGIIQGKMSGIQLPQGQLPWGEFHGGPLSVG